MADDRQKLKCNKVVAILLPVMQDAPHHCHNSQRDEQSLQRHPWEDSCVFRGQGISHGFLYRIQDDMHQPEARQDRKEDGAQIPDGSQRDGKEHNRKERPHQTDQTSHDADTASSSMDPSPVFPRCICTCCTHTRFAHTAASFPYCSSSICDR